MTTRTVHSLDNRPIRGSFGLLWVGLLLVLSCLCVAPAWADGLKGGVEYTEDSYRLGPGDTLSVHVYNQKDFEQTGILVRDDGKASFYSIGEVAVAGKTVDEVTQQVREKISDLLVEPIVTISLTQARPGVVYVAGAVKHPGMFQISTMPAASGEGDAKGDDAASTGQAGRSGLRLSNVLTMAGGVNLNADLSRIEVRRGPTDDVKRVNLWHMLKDAAGDEDMWLQSGDSVFVPAMAQGKVSAKDANLVLSSTIGPGSFPVRILGEVNTPGVYDLVATSPYLNSGIAKAGGFKIGANREVIAIRRLSGNNMFNTLYVNSDQREISLQPNDIVFVAEKNLYKTGRFFETVAKIFAPFNFLPFVLLN